MIRHLDVGDDSAMLRLLLRVASFPHIRTLCLRVPTPALKL